MFIELRRTVVIVWSSALLQKDDRPLIENVRPLTSRDLRTASTCSLHGPVKFFYAVVYDSQCALRPRH